MNRPVRITVLLIILLGLISAAVTHASDECLIASGCRPEAGVSAEIIATYSQPNVETLPVNEDRLYDRFYQQTTDRVDIFDSPGGNVTGALDAGFNFFTTLSRQDGWIQVNVDQWVQDQLLENSMGVVSHFSGVLLPTENLPFPMAWALVNMYPSTEPGGEPSDSNPLIYRYTQLNLYAAVEIDGEIWYQVGVDQWVHQHHIAKIIPVDRPSDVDTDHWISIDLYEQVVVAYEHNQPVFATLVSSGLPRWPTQEGLFHIYFRREREHMSGGEPGDDFYYLEEVPWTMFFDAGRALHGAYWHDGFGYRRSHGCVNLSITDAYWLYNWVAEEMGSRASADREVGPAVYVYSSGQYK